MFLDPVLSPQPRRPMYRVISHGDAIHCGVCGRISHNPEDVKQHYCGSCHLFLDDVVNLCLWCGEPVLTTDLVSHALINGEHQHYECALRALVGGVNHQLGRCSCCGSGDMPPDDEHVTRRDAARAATRLWLAENDPTNHSVWMAYTDRTRTPAANEASPEDTEDPPQS